MSTKATKPGRLGEWTIWANRPPPREGWYWLAGYYPETEEDSESEEPESPIIWEVSEKEISGAQNPQNILGFHPDNLIWSGPLEQPVFTNSKGISFPD